MNVKKENYNYNSPNNFKEILLEYEMHMPHLKELNKKRTFNNKLPLPNTIKCKPHFFSLEELLAFMSFLTKDMVIFIFFLIYNIYVRRDYIIDEIFSNFSVQDPFNPLIS